MLSLWYINERIIILQMIGFLALYTFLQIFFLDFGKICSLKNLNKSNKYKLTLNKICHKEKNLDWLINIELNYVNYSMFTSKLKSKSLSFC